MEGPEHGSRVEVSMTPVVWATLGTPVGPVSVGCRPAGLAGVRFRASPTTLATGDRDTANTVLWSARDQLAEYFAGQRKMFDVPIDWSSCSGSQQSVLRTLLDTVGYGQTITYGELARRSGVAGEGVPLPARAIGQIMGANPFPLIVPCHRVVAGNGLGGYSGGTGIEAKRWLLTFEGALPATLDWDAAHA
jgi:methylated-DNA-[protein]-cysteine S-methyltransferase